MQSPNSPRTKSTRISSILAALHNDFWNLQETQLRPSAICHDLLKRIVGHSVSLLCVFAVILRQVRGFSRAMCGLVKSRYLFQRRIRPTVFFVYRHFLFIGHWRRLNEVPQRLRVISLSQVPIGVYIAWLRQQTATDE